MADMHTTYGGGRATTTTRGLGSAGGAGMLLDPSVLGQILSRRLKEREEDRGFEIQQRERFKRQQRTEDTSTDPRGFRAGGGGISGGGFGGGVRRAAIPEIGEPVRAAAPEGRGVDALLEDRERAARLMELQAASGPAPTRVVGGAGIISGRTLDPLAMNAYQRRLFLPQSSQLVVPPSERGIGEELEEFEGQNLRRRARARALERMQAGAGPTRVTGWGG